MDSPYGKIAILIGAGLVGSILAKENRLPIVSSLFKGWKLPDLMFVRRRSSADARETIVKQHERLYTSLLALQSQLSSRIKLLETAKLTSTRDVITGIASEVATIRANIAYLQSAIAKLEIRLLCMDTNRIDRSRTV